MKLESDASSSTIRILMRLVGRSPLNPILILDARLPPHKITGSFKRTYFGSNQSQAGLVRSAGVRGGSRETPYPRIKEACANKIVGNRIGATGCLPRSRARRLAA